MKRRLDVLDGLRGFAIILVFLNHIDSHFIKEALPVFLQPIVSFLFTSGNLGVTFFFILSGFLMGYLYTNPDPMGFIERRYARIFPPFIAMALCMWVFRLSPTLNLVLRVGLILSVALVVRLLWVHVVERFRFGPHLIRIFLFLQLGVAFWYGFIIMRSPPIWFDSLPFFLKEGTIFAANATLTLPLGNYIPLLDGVYWSLAPEMIFYLLYPYLFSPTVDILKKKSPPLVSIFVLTLFLFFFGLSLLFKHTQGLSMLFIEYFIYFCGGIAIANHARNHPKKTESKASSLLVNPFTFLSLLFLAFLALGVTSGGITIIVRLLLVIPFGYVVYSLVEEESPLSTLFKRPQFLFLGMISYSMYIGHTALVDGMHLIFRPYDLLTNLLFLIFTAIIFLLVATALHTIIEKPYFEFKPEKKAIQVAASPRSLPYLILFFIILFLFFTAYTSQFNFFSQQKKYKDVIVSSVKITDKPFTFTFTAQEDNMGIILLHLTNVVGDTLPKDAIKIDPNIHQRFQIRMKEVGSDTWYASQDTAPAEIGNSASYPFGFPVIAESKGRKYVVELAIVNVDYSSAVLFNKDEYPLTTVHQIQKKTLLTNPIMLMMHTGEKLQAAFTNPEAITVLLCIMPFFILLFVLLYVS